MRQRRAHERSFLLGKLLAEAVSAAGRPGSWREQARGHATDLRLGVFRRRYRQAAHFGQFKSHQFGGAAIREHWQLGSADVSAALRHPRWVQLPDEDVAFEFNELEDSGAR